MSDKENEQPTEFDPIEAAKKVLKSGQLKDQGYQMIALLTVLFYDSLIKMKYSRVDASETACMLTKSFFLNPILGKTGEPEK
jgi:hypothetical protein